MGRGTQASSVSLGQRKDFTALTPTSSSLGRGSGRRRRSSGQLLLGMPAQPRACPDPTPTQLFSDASDFLHPHSPPQNRLQSPYPSSALSHPGREPLSPGLGQLLLCLLCLDKSSLWSGTPYTRPSLCQPPPPPSARIQPWAGPGGVTDTHKAGDRGMPHVCMPQGEGGCLQAATQEAEVMAVVSTSPTPPATGHLHCVTAATGLTASSLL